MSIGGRGHCTPLEFEEARPEHLQPFYAGTLPAFDPLNGTLAKAAEFSELMRRQSGENATTARQNSHIASAPFGGIIRCPLAR